MHRFVVLVLLSFFLYELTVARILIRSKRQIEREGIYRNESTVVVNGDREPIDFQLPNSNNGNTDVMEVDFNKDDGSFSFGGRFPTLFNRNFNNGFNGFDALFRQMAKRFEGISGFCKVTVY